MEMDFKGKVCVVSGSGGGMGRALAVDYARHGADVVMIGSNQERLNQTASLCHAFGGRILPIIANVSIKTDVDEIFSQIEAALGKVDILANCAGTSVSSLLLDLDEADWDQVLDFNLKSVFLMSQCAAKLMIKHSIPNGKITSISSISSKIGEYGNGVYSVSKAGINTLTQVLAQELGRYNISVTAVCPGYVNTHLLQEAIHTRAPIEGMTPAEYEQFLVSNVPMGRMASPEEIASFMLYLTSDSADYISGVSLTMAGGKMLL